MPKIVDKEAKKQEILAAAIQVFAQKGIAYSKMVDIASQAGIGKGTIYEYYASKEDLVLDTWRMMDDSMESALIQRLDGIESPENVLRETAMGMIEGILVQPDAVGIMLDFWAEGFRHSLLSKVKESHCELQVRVANSFELGMKQERFRQQDPNLLGLMYTGVLHGLILHWIADQDSFPLKESAEQAVEIFLQGLKNPETKEG